MSLPPSDLIIKGVVFDLDGLMFNTEQVFHIAGNELVRRKGSTMTRALSIQMMGRRWQESLLILKESLGLSESVLELKEESDEIFHGLLAEMLEPMPGLFEILARIDQLGLPRGVATSSQRSYLEDILGRYDLLGGFAFTMSAEDVEFGKPHPEIYLKAAERIGAKPAEILVMEDSGIGTAAGVAAGVHIVSIPHEHSADHVFTGTKFMARSLKDDYLWRIFEQVELAFR